MNLRERIEQKLALMADKAAHDKASKELKEQIEEVDHEIMNLMEDVGIEQAKSGNTTVFVQKTMVPTVDDWDAFYKYIIDHKAMHLLERRAATRAWRELYEGGETVPGTEPFEKVSLGKRTSNG